MVELQARDNFRMNDITQSLLRSNAVTHSLIYRYVVSVKDGDLHLCGGMIYSTDWIVTAASCVVE